MFSFVLKLVLKCPITNSAGDIQIFHLFINTVKPGAERLNFHRGLEKSKCRRVNILSTLVNEPRHYVKRRGSFPEKEVSQCGDGDWDSQTHNFSLPADRETISLSQQNIKKINKNSQADE